MNRYSTLGNRIVALIIDSLVIAPIIIAFVILTGMDIPNWVYYLIFPVESILTVGYFILFHWKYGQTVGKMVAKVKVVDISEQPISFGQANSQIGLKPTPVSARNAFPVAKYGRHGGKLVRAHRMMREYDVIVKETLRFHDAEIGPEGLLVLDLRTAKAISKEKR